MTTTINSFILHELASHATTISAGLELISDQAPENAGEILSMLRRASRAINLTMSYMRSAFISNTLSLKEAQGLLADYFALCHQVSLGFESYPVDQKTSIFQSRSLFVLLLWGVKFLRAQKISIDCPDRQQVRIAFMEVSKKPISQPVIGVLAESLETCCQSEGVVVETLEGAKNVFILTTGPSIL